MSRPRNTDRASRFRQPIDRLGTGGLGPLLVRAVAGSGLVRIAGMLSSFAVGVLLARGLGVEGYGLYGIALAVVTIAAIPGELGIPLLVTREVAAASAEGDHRRLFGVLRWADRTTLAIGGFIALCVAAAGLLLYQLGRPALGATLALGAPVIPLIALAKGRSGALQGLGHNVRGQVPWALLRPVILAVLLGIAIAAGAKLTPALAMALTSLGAAAVLVVGWRWLNQRLPAAPPAPYAKHSKHWLASTIPMGLMEGMRVLHAELAILLVGLVAAPAAVGLLRIANVTATIAATAVGIVLTIGLPILSRLNAEENPRRLQKAVSALGLTQFAGVSAVAIPLFLFAEPLLAAAFGPDFGAADDALRIILAAQLVNAAFGLNSTVLVVSGHERRIARAMALALALTAVLVPPLTWRWGATGAAAALFLSMTCWNVIAWHDATKLAGIDTSVFGGLRRR